MTPASAGLLMRHANRIAARTDMTGHDPATLALDAAEAICGKLTETRLTYVIRSEPELVGYALIRLTADGTAPRELYGYLEDLPGPLLESVALRLLHTWTDTCRTIAETVLRTVEGTERPWEALLAPEQPDGRVVGTPDGSDEPTAPHGAGDEG